MVGAAETLLNQTLGAGAVLGQGQPAPSLALNLAHVPRRSCDLDSRMLAAAAAV